MGRPGAGRVEAGFAVVVGTAGSVGAAGSAAGVVVAVGHTDADFATTRQALEWGATGATHLFNAMPPLHHRDPGPILALLRRRLTDDEVQEVCEAVAAQSGADPEISLVDTQVLMMKVLGELPGEGDVERVRARLEESDITLN